MRRCVILRLGAVSLLALGLIGANKAAPVFNKAASSGDANSAAFTRPLPGLHSTCANPAGVLTPETLNIPLDVAGTTIPLTVCNSTDWEETYTVKTVTLERTRASRDAQEAGHHGIKTSIEPAQLTLKPGEKQVVQLKLANPMQALRAGQYRLVIAAEGSRGSKGRSVIVGNAPSAVMVSALDPILDAGTVKRGLFSVMGRFNVEANTGRIQLQIAVTNLYFNDDPTERFTPSIPVHLDNGLQIASVGGNFTAGTVAFQGRNTTIESYLATNSYPITVTEVQDQGLRDTICVTAQWSQDVLDKPVGTYYGRIRLTALVLPDE